MTSENINIGSIVEQIKASQQNVLKVFEEHNIFVNKSLEKLQQMKTETKVEVVKVKDPLEEIKRVREEFDKVYVQENDLEHIKKELQSPLLKVSEYENNPRTILRLGWIESITFKECKNIKSISLHFQNCRNENKFKYFLDETSNDYTIYFGSIDSIRVVNNCIHTSMFPIYLLPYQEVYFTCEKIDETKACNADMLYKYCTSNKHMNIHLKPVIFTIQNKNFLIKNGCIQNEIDDLVDNDVSKTQDEYLEKIVNILSLYDTSKISTSFKDTFLTIFNKCIQSKYQTESFKQNILKVRDIRWLLIEMEKYPQIFQFTEDDLTILKENGASRDNIYLVKKFLKKDGDYEEYYPEEEGGGIKCKYHMTGGCINGEYNEWHEDGSKKTVRNYKDGKSSGISTTWYKNGKIETFAEFKDGLWNGEYNAWYDNGNKMYEIFFKNNKRHGTRIDYHPNGKPSELKNYINGLQVGEYKVWNDNEKLLIDNMYDDTGKAIKIKQYNNSGYLELEKILLNDGIYELKRYYESTGKLHYRVMMIDGKWNGEYTSYWNNGNICTKCYYKNDKLDGEWEYWNQDGTLKEKIIYKYGEKQV